MKAALIYSYGSPDVLELHSEVKIPEPQANEVLIRVRAAGINPVDCKLRKGAFKLFTGFMFPKILGFDVAGEVVGIGNRVSHFRIGDAVMGLLQSFNQGSYAQFTVAKQNILVQKPKNLSFEESAAVPLAGLTAFQALSKGGIENGMRVLILGGAGGVGSFAVQIAKTYDCTVTASAGPNNQLFLRELGADFTFDYTCQTVADLDGKFDIVVDAVGRSSFAACRPILTSRGSYITTLPTWTNAGSLLFSPLRAQAAKVFLTRSSHRDLQILKKLIEKGRIRPIIDRNYSLEQIREAHLYVQAEHVRGKTVITMPD